MGGCPPPDPSVGLCRLRLGLGPKGKGSRRAGAWAGVTEWGGQRGQAGSPLRAGAGGLGSLSFPDSKMGLSCLKP